MNIMKKSRECDNLTASPRMEGNPTIFPRLPACVHCQFLFHSLTIFKLFSGIKCCNKMHGNSVFIGDVKRVSKEIINFSSA